MAFDEQLASRVRKQLDGVSGVSEKKMFGGIAFLLRGNMCVGVLGAELMVRTGPELTPAALKEPGARPFDMTGRPMKGWVVVGAAGMASPAAFRKWVRRGVDYASALPAK